MSTQAYIMWKLHKKITTAYSLGLSAIKHSCVYEIRTHSCSFNTSLSQTSHLYINRLRKTNCCKFTCTVICKIKQ